jgi:uncharacterized membrane protein YfcA
LENLPLFILLALLAEILGTIGGFGSSLFFIPIASYFLDFHSVLGVTALFHVSSNLAKIGIFKGGFDKKIALSLGIPAIVFVIIGALLSKYVETKFLEITLSIFLILISLFFLFKKEFQVKPTFANTLGGGIFSGFVAGLIGTGGAIRGIVLASYNLKMEVFIVTSAMIDLCIDASRSVVYFYNGYMHKDDFYLIPILLVISILGTFIGKKILLLVSEKQFKSFVLILVFITGCLSLIKFVN